MQLLNNLLLTVVLFKQYDTSTWWFLAAMPAIILSWLISIAYDKEMKRKMLDQYTTANHKLLALHLNKTQSNDDESNKG